MAIKNQVQLITYADSLGGDLDRLNHILNTYFLDVFKGGVHILPPFPSSGDRGFAPIDYLAIEPSFGDWSDIQEIGKNFDVVVDLIVNHISRQSKYFQNFLENGRDSQYADMFITLDKLWPDGKPRQEDIDKMFLRRTTPYSSYTIEKTGETERVWTTFGKSEQSEQIDIDIFSETTRKMISEIVANFSKQGIKIVRLDAVGYIVKSLGTSCFFVEPEIFEILSWLKELANEHNLEILPEIHSHYSIQFKMAEKGYWIYDFILPYRIVEALTKGESEYITDYLSYRPHNQFTMLDCHDGLPLIPDMNDLVDVEEAAELVNVFLERGSNLSKIKSEKHKGKDGFDVHQIRGTIYSMLACNDDAYIAARALQFFAPGIPQVYYVGMLAGENDMERAEETGDGREINRHNFTLQEIEHAIKKDVVQRLIALIKFRNDYPAFNGSFEVLPSEDNIVCLQWKRNKSVCTLFVDLTVYRTKITYTDDSGQQIVFNV